MTWLSLEEAPGVWPVQKKVGKNTHRRKSAKTLSHQKKSPKISLSSDSVLYQSSSQPVS